MPKGKHKGKHRVFTNPEQLAEEEKREEREREWRHKRGEESESESGSGSGSGSDSDSSSEEEKQPVKPKGPQVAVENPNRVQQRNKKLSQLTVDDKAPQSRREREAAEKEKARQHYQKLHAQGKTAEAQSDLARLAIIRKQREDAAKKRDEEKKAKEAAKDGGRAKR